MRTPAQIQTELRWYLRKNGKVGVPQPGRDRERSVVHFMHLAAEALHTGLVDVRPRLWFGSVGLEVNGLWDGRTTVRIVRDRDAVGLAGAVQQMADVRRARAFIKVHDLRVVK